MTNVETVQKCYEFFGLGDGENLLALFDPAIEFRLAEGHPYRMSGKPWNGPQQVAEEFLMRAGPEWEGWEVRVADIVEAGDAVVVEGRYHGLYKPTGRVMDVQVCHVWRLAGGKVKSFHQYVDTSRLQGVMGPGS